VALDDRGLLITSGMALSGLFLRGNAEAKMHSCPVRLSLNENPFGPSSLALAAIQSQLGDICRYADYGANVLAHAAAARENVSADQIVLGEILGALGLHLAMNGPPGGEFIYSEPGYTALVDAVTPGGGVAIGVPLDEHLQNDLAGIAARVTRRTRAIFLVNPHNPTGTVNHAAKFRTFVNEMSDLTTVIVDEAYLEFEPDLQERTVTDLTRAGRNVVVFRTFGKIYSLAGLSMGYAIAPIDLATLLTRAGLGVPGTLNRLALAAAAESLRDTHYLATVRAKVVTEREKWNTLFDSMNLRHSDSRGNFVFFETGRPHKHVATAMLAKGVDIGRAFPPLEHWARISIGLPDENAIARAAIADLLALRR
jgi:histidinol-phosphate aminotransferase